MKIPTTLNLNRAYGDLNIGYFYVVEIVLYPPSDWLVVVMSVLVKEIAQRLFQESNKGN